MAVKTVQKGKRTIPGAPRLLDEFGEEPGAIPAAKFDGTAFPAQGRIPLPTKGGTFRTLPGPGLSVGLNAPGEERGTTVSQGGGGEETEEERKAREARERLRTTVTVGEETRLEPAGSGAGFGEELDPEAEARRAAEQSLPRTQGPGSRNVLGEVLYETPGMEANLKKGKPLTPSELLQFAVTSNAFTLQEIEAYLQGKTPLDEKKLGALEQTLLRQLSVGEQGRLLTDPAVARRLRLGTSALYKPLSPEQTQAELTRLRAGRAEDKDLSPLDKQTQAAAVQTLFSGLSADPKMANRLRDLKITNKSTDSEIAMAVSDNDIYGLYEKGTITADQMASLLSLRQKSGIEVETPEEGTEAAFIFNARKDLQQKVFGATGATGAGAFDYNTYMSSTQALLNDLPTLMRDPAAWYKAVVQLQPPSGASVLETSAGTPVWGYSDEKLRKDPLAQNALARYQAVQTNIESMRKNVDAAAETKLKMDADDATLNGARNRYETDRKTGNFRDAVTAQIALTNAERKATESKAMWEAVTAEFSLFRDPDALALWNNSGGLRAINEKYGLNITLPKKADRQQVLTLIQTDPTLRAALKQGDAGTIMKAMRSIVLLTSWTSDELVALVQSSRGAGSMAGGAGVEVSTVERE